MGANLCGSLIVSVSKEQLQESGEHWHLLPFLHTGDPNHRDYPINLLNLLENQGFRIRTVIHFIRIRIQHCRLNGIPIRIWIRIRIQSFMTQKCEKFTAVEKLNFTYS
jgi:hypothetical protein